jgi:hypothetical protein
VSPVAHCAPLTVHGAAQAGAPGGGNPGTASPDLIAEVFDLSNCTHTVLGGIPVQMVAAGSECTVGCAPGRQRVGPLAVFSCPPGNTDSAAQPQPRALASPSGSLSRLPTCFEKTEHNPSLSPPQGISVACASGISEALTCAQEIRRSHSAQCGIGCQDSVDEMFSACAAEAGWRGWQAGVRDEIRKAGCAGCVRAAANFTLLGAVVVLFVSI